MTPIQKKTPDPFSLTFVGVVTVTGKDTLTWHGPRREGGLVEGPSPTYTFKRVKTDR